MRVLHFGAGRIGLGLVVPFFCADHQVILVDRKSHLVDDLGRNGYALVERDRGTSRTTPIRGFQAIGYQDLDRVVDIDLVTTSVIERNLPEIAPAIAGVLRRNRKTAYVIPMENSLDAVDVLGSALRRHLGGLEGVVLLRCVIDRIVSGFSANGDLVCEPYSRVVIEDRCGISDLLPAPVLSDRIEREFQSKFYVVNGLHACAAYLGFERGFVYLHEALGCLDIERQLVEIGACYARFLSSRHGIPVGETEGYMEQVIGRFKNEGIRDEISRVGRNLLIKLAENGRILGPLRYNRDHGLPYEPLLDVVRAADGFHLAADYDAYIRMRRRLDAAGWGLPPLGSA